jgi:hypothetical protein
VGLEFAVANDTAICLENIFLKHYRFDSPSASVPPSCLAYSSYGHANSHRFVLFLFSSNYFLSAFICNLI